LRSEQTPAHHQIDQGSARQQGAHGDDVGVGVDKADKADENADQKPTAGSYDVEVFTRPG